jgi:hypothetical protein
MIGGSAFNNLIRSAKAGFVLACFLSAVLLVVSACSSVHGKFEQSITDYNDLLRWHKLEEASRFASDATSTEYVGRMLAAKNMKVFDYHIVRTNYSEAKKEAEVLVEFEYYTLSTNTLKTLLDVQKWAYVKEDGAMQWKLMSPLPEFK